MCYLNVWNEAKVEPLCRRTKVELLGVRTEADLQVRSQTKLKGWTNEGQSKPRKSVAEVEQRLTKVEPREGRSQGGAV